MSGAGADPPYEPNLRSASSLVTAGSHEAGLARAEACTVCITKQDVQTKLGLEFGVSRDGKWVVVADVRAGSPASSFPELKTGSKLLDIEAGGRLESMPAQERAIELITSAVGELRLTVAPLVDRYGFIVDLGEFEARALSRTQVRQENEELRKWEKRVGSVHAWKLYSANKPDKLRTRIRQGVPDAVRGFVWKAVAAARATNGFRQDGLYRSLRMQQEESAAASQIDKDVPRTMTGHIHFRAANSKGKASLGRMLKAYAAFRPALGYTQGMASYAAVLLLYMDEEDAFWVFSLLMEHCTLSGLFKASWRIQK